MSMLLSASMQRTCVAELRAAYSLVEDGTTLQPLVDEVHCNCIRFRPVSLSCRHVQQQKFVLGTTLAKWVWQNLSAHFG